MGRKVRVTNINEDGTVHVQAGRTDEDPENQEKVTDVTNVNRGGTVGIQAGTVTGSSVHIRW